jgi:hypothetical protein
MNVKRLLTNASLFLFALAIQLGAQGKYDGPVPDKADLPHIRHANKLVPTEAGVASQSSVKNDTLYTVSGATSPARTPVVEPIFIVKVEKLNIQQMTLYKMEVKNGQRQLLIPAKPGKNSPKPLRMTLDVLRTGLYKLEAQEPLYQGEYCLSPNGSNDVYCFTVY